MNRLTLGWNAAHSRLVMDSDALLWEQRVSIMVEQIAAKFGRESDRFLGMPNKFQEMMPKLAHHLCIDLANSQGELVEAMGEDSVPAWNLRTNIYNIRGATVLWLIAAREERWLLNLQDTHNYGSGGFSKDAPVEAGGAAKTAGPTVSDKVDPRMRLALLISDVADKSPKECEGYVCCKKLKQIINEYKWANPPLLWATLNMLGEAGAIIAVDRMATDSRSKAWLPERGLHATLDAATPSTAALQDAASSAQVIAYVSPTGTKKRKAGGGVSTATQSLSVTVPVAVSSGIVASPLVEETITDMQKAAKNLKKRTCMVAWERCGDPVESISRGGHGSYPNVTVRPVDDWGEGETKAAVIAWRRVRSQSKKTEVYQEF